MNHAQEDRKAMEESLKMRWKLREKVFLLGWILRADGIMKGVSGLSRQWDQGEPNRRKCKGCPGSNLEHRGRVRLIEVKGKKVAEIGNCTDRPRTEITYKQHMWKWPCALCVRWHKAGCAEDPENTHCGSTLLMGILPWFPFLFFALLCHHMLSLNRYQPSLGASHRILLTVLFNPKIQDTRHREV